jgi:hypothetical protein
MSAVTMCDCQLSSTPRLNEVLYRNLIKARVKRRTFHVPNLMLTRRPLGVNLGSVDRASPPPNHPTTQPPNHPTTQPPNHPTTQPPNHPTTRPPNHPTTQPPTVKAPHTISSAFRSTAKNGHRESFQLKFYREIVSFTLVGFYPRYTHVQNTQ